MNKGKAEAGRNARHLTWNGLIAWAVVAMASFHTAQVFGLVWLLIPCAYALIELSHAPTKRKVFYPTLALGLLLYAPHLSFFWNIFNAAAIALWLALAFWLALFALTLRLVRLRWGQTGMLCLAPVLWTGLEYFRGELYYLRFTWLSFGMASHAQPGINQVFGMYGLGSVIVAVAALIHAGMSHRPKVALATSVVIAVSLSGASQLLHPIFGIAEKSIRVAGVQLEFPSDREVIASLHRARAKFPDTELFMLSEYTFQEPVPLAVREWCASNHAYLVVGGKEPVDDIRFYNMAYVIGPDGSVVHQQVKSVPIQFFKDGLPAPRRTVWNSPWGKLGVLTCYDLSYTRIADDFVRQGAIALLNPTMDVIDWGKQQHALHARIAPVRSAEYRLPIFRVASSGVSQITDAGGNVLTSAPFPGEGAIVGGELPLHGVKPTVPLLHHLAPACTVVSLAALVFSLIPSRKSRIPTPQSAP